MKKKLGVIIDSDNRKMPKWQFDLVQRLREKFETTFIIGENTTIQRNSILQKITGLIDKKILTSQLEQFERVSLDSEESMTIEEFNQSWDKKNPIFILPSSGIIGLEGFRTYYFEINGTTNNLHENTIYNLSIEKPSSISISLQLVQNSQKEFLGQLKSNIDHRSIIISKAHIFSKFIELLQYHLDGNENILKSVPQLKKINQQNHASQVRYLLKTIFKILKNVILKENFILLKKSKDDNSFEAIKPPSKYLQADPFLYNHKGKNYMFYEHMRFKGKGEIFVEELGKDIVRQKKCVLKTNSHLSYPHIVKQQNNILLIPESSENKTISVYKNVDFPYQWQFVKHLFTNINAVDSTFIFWNNVWYMFSSINRNPHQIFYDELFIYYNEGDFLEGDWKSHPQNPVISDPKFSRMAGEFFISGGQLIRPAQDCYAGYGKKVIKCVIEKLSTTEYRENPFEKILIKANIKTHGNHTFNASETFSVSDAKIWSSRF